MKKVILTLFSICLVTIVLAQQVRYVASDATGTANGTSWANAFTSLDSAFAYYQNGDTIWVKTGTYKPVGGTNADFQPPNGSVLYGGFSGTETSINQRLAGAMSNLDGDINTNGVNSDNCRRVLYFSNNTSEIVINGFKIINGYAYTIGGSITVGGGGARVSQGRVRFENCEFSDNYTYMRGGALAIYGSASRVKLINCVFKNNLSSTSTSSGLGGAIFCNAGTLTIDGCEFTSNTARRGGAISSYQPTITINRTVFSGNEAANSFGGAIDNGSETALSIYNSLFVGNVASTTGAAIYTSTTLNVEFQKFIGCTFAHNWNGSASSSYAVYASDRTTVANCILWGNRGGKQLFNLPPAIEPTVENCIIQDDTLSNGSNMYYGDPQFINPGTASSTPFALGSLDYRVTSASEAINNGNNSRVNSNYDTDVLDTTRIIGGTADIGAYESPFISYTVTLLTNISNVASTAGGGQVFEDSIANVSTSRLDDCYRFLRWEENGTTVSSFQSFNVKITSNRTFTAIWERKTTSATLTSDPSFGGTVEGGGTFDCDLDSVRTFTAIPADCYEFISWTINGGVVSTSPVYTARLSGDISMVANFAYGNYTVVAEPNISGAGVVTGAGEFLCDSLVTLTATTDDCYTFSNWTEDGLVIGTDTFLSFKIKEDRNIVANYEAIQYAINVVVDPVLGGEVIGDGPADCGSEVVLTAVRKFNYVFAGWEEDGTVFSTNSEYRFTAEEDRNLKANFTFTGSVDGIETAQMKVFPNPVGDRLTLTSDDKPIDAVYFYDMRGALVLAKDQIGTLHLELNTSALVPGVYMLKISSDGRLLQQRLVVH